MVSDLERFIACMEYQPSDRRPNHELGVWPQARTLWMSEAPEAAATFQWRWFHEEDAIGLDKRDYIPVNYDLVPPFQHEVIEETERYEVYRSNKGIVHRALKEGTDAGGRMCMDQYISFPVETPDDWAKLKRERLIPALDARYPADLDERIAGWKERDYPLVLGENCAANGFYWRAREFMGTEALSLAWYDYPEMMHDMMEWFVDFIIETSLPVLEKIDVEYFVLNEDLSMKSGPLLSPATYRKFILPRLKRLVSTLKDHGVRYIALDTDGNPTVLVSQFMEAGVDILWPLERASEISPVTLRQQFGKELRLWGGVDKRVLPHGPEAIKAHLLELAPLIEEGGYIPTIDHTVPPDVSFENFMYYIEFKQYLLAGEFAKLG
ncbi:MAG: uroporphyrinogen decarboxylase family protein [Anaerolineae bacterium]|jgi:hypothetical protein